jgi:Flp pilus assembly protein TadD
MAVCLFTPRMAPSPASSPDLATAYRNAVTAYQENRLAEAAQGFADVLALKPDHLDVLNIYGVTLLGLQRWHEAADTFERLLTQQPNHAEALNNRAYALQQLGCLDAARASFDAAVKVAATNADILKNRGLLLLEMRAYDDALKDFEAALALKPDFAEAANERGNTLLKLNRVTDALASFDRAIALKPDQAAFHSHRGGALMRLRRMTEALEAYATAQKLDSTHAKAHLNEAMCRLMIGDVAAGWAKYEYRWHCEPMSAARKHFTVPLWLGDTDIAGKTILLHAEQGAGDTIQFCRYAPLLAQRGARVLMQVPASLKNLMLSLEGVTRVFAEGEALTTFDVHCPMMSLPLAFRTTADRIPAHTPYLHPVADKAAAWHQRLPKTGLRVGLVWSGDPRHGEDHNRSIALAQLEPLLKTKTAFVSLQKEYREGDQANVQQHANVQDVSANLHDFADTAALISALDLVISIDTSVAHLAGALGKPVWILLPHLGLDWRWQLERTDSPWYPSVRLFRQPQPGDWGSVIAVVIQNLSAL